ncbi:MAG TPA: formimidoylglutamate deiminase [Pseudonocardia sp.]|uniref:formimidoylglutamate deiminase n=1 Tax=Pseudonocardia sp. TaxID=60912 RepID=UPI002C571E98|nr:formimidoylglutamate deiminase [Pseudonocardia sp.]HTF46828.1 formimidoylglutamate deiminase [Pseudonocardia sp.]
MSVAVAAEFWCERAWLPGGVAERVSVGCDEAGVITSVAPGVDPGQDMSRLSGVVFPGFANGHSHAFHRGLRGRTHAGGGTFWTWRDAMYRLAGRLDPDTYHRLAGLVYAEMALAGFVVVGEFHYLHHPPGGGRYADPNAMGEALLAAAAHAGIRITLLDTCYLAGGLDGSGYQPLSGPQVRFGDGDVAGWAARWSALAERPGARVGAAVHSVRAVPAEALPGFAAATRDRPVHVHLSEQPAENEACQAFHGCSPTELLAGAGLLGPRTTAVHATHLSDKDVELLGAASVTACFCPTTEADLADGIGPARELADAGCPISLGSDQHAVIDPLAEARALEHGERLRTGQRGRFSPAELVAAATERGHRSLGWPDGGRIAIGAPCDLVAVRTDTARTAGASADQLVLAGSAADVDSVVVGGRMVVSGGVHRSFGSVGAELARVIEGLWSA